MAGEMPAWAVPRLQPSHNVCQLRLLPTWRSTNCFLVLRTDLGGVALVVLPERLAAVAPLTLLLPAGSQRRGRASCLGNARTRACEGRVAAEQSGVRAVWCSCAQGASPTDHQHQPSHVLQPSAPPRVSTNSTTHLRLVSLAMMATMAAVPMAAPRACGAEVKERAAAEEEGRAARASRAAGGGDCGAVR